MFFHQYTLRIIDTRMHATFVGKGIPCAIYHPIPLHLHATDARHKEEDFSVTNQLVKQVISLLMHT
jgi:dTDP-4-amino-4,6-dideoxygalactose transaminase